MKNKLEMTQEEFKILINTLEHGLNAYGDGEPDADGEGGYMVFQLNEDGVFEEPDIEHKQQVLQGIIDRIEVIDAD